MPKSPKNLSRKTKSNGKAVSPKSDIRMSTIACLFEKQKKKDARHADEEDGDVFITKVTKSGIKNEPSTSTRSNRLKLQKSLPQQNTSIKTPENIAEKKKDKFHDDAIFPVPEKLDSKEYEISVKQADIHVHVVPKKRLSLKKRKNSQNDVLNNKRKKVEDGSFPTCTVNLKHEANDDLNDSEGTDLTTNQLEDEKKTPVSNLSKISEKPNSDSNSSENVENSEEASELEEPYIPYYLENFRTVIDAVLGDPDNDSLLNSDDHLCIHKWKCLTENSQQLYIRLFTRKLAWIPKSRIKYPKIAEDLSPCMRELVGTGFLLPVEELQDLETALKILQLSDIKTLGKLYHINVTSQNKEEILSALLKKSKQNTIGSMFNKSSSHGTSTMLNRAKNLLGECVHLSRDERSVFIRLLMLFSPTNNSMEDDSATAESNQLFQMLMVNIGKVVYPKFTVNKQHKIYKDREDFIRFTNALLLEMDYLSAVERKKYEEAYELFQKAEAMYKQEVKLCLRHDKSLPDFLRGFTSCGVYVGVMSQAVDVIQRRKDYTQANTLLEALLAQSIYCQTSRGLWSERLALNLEVHCKQPQKALDIIEKSLKDPYVRTGRRYALYQRAEKLCSAPKTKFKNQMKKFKHYDVTETPKVTLEGKVLPDNITTARYRFILDHTDDLETNNDLTFAGVEQFVLNHYLHNGYSHGLHAEGSILSGLSSLFFWDIIFMDIPDVFRSTFQTRPLDLTTVHFYNSRKEQIDSRLEKLRTSTEEELCCMAEEVWTQQDGCLGMNWDLFENLQHAQGLIRCLGGEKLSQILKRTMEDPRNTRGGFPDLTLWNVNDGKVKICEVKGPGDRLSHRQILWIDYLVSAGIDAEVCHVKAVGTKKLKASS